jgi:hypothetical protein
LKPPGPKHGIISVRNKPDLEHARALAAYNESKISDVNLFAAFSANQIACNLSKRPLAGPSVE